MSADAQNADSVPAYPMPGKCEGRVRRSGTAWLPGGETRCQRPPTHWSAEKFAWLCNHHDRGWQEQNDGSNPDATR